MKILLHKILLQHFLDNIATILLEDQNKKFLLTSPNTHTWKTPVFLQFHVLNPRLRYT